LNPFTLFYILVAAVLYVALLPFILFLSLKPKYRESIPARFFLRSNGPFDKPGIWFHVCSLGEARALKPLLDRLENRQINITTTTQTGFAEALKYDADVRYLPYELFLPFWVKKEKVVVVLEAEFWYLLFAVAHARGARLLLVNARISERSFPKYKKMRWLYRRMLTFVDTVYCQSQADRERFIRLGAAEVKVIGNIKLAQQIRATAEYVKPDSEVIVAASTHETEEEPIIRAYLEYTLTHQSRLIVVPRHPERFAAVWEMIQTMAQEHTVSRWSESRSLDAEITLIDAMGELNNIYAISDIAILGGAFKEDVGGHNPLEPAHFGCKIITGRHAYMQQELFKYVRDVQIVEPDAIKSALIRAKSMRGSHVDEKIDLDAVINEIVR